MIPTWPTRSRDLRIDSSPLVPTRRQGVEVAAASAAEVAFHRSTGCKKTSPWLLRRLSASELTRAECQFESSAIDSDVFFFVPNSACYLTDALVNSLTKALACFVSSNKLTLTTGSRKLTICIARLWRRASECLVAGASRMEEYQWTSSLCWRADGFAL